MHTKTTGESGFTLVETLVAIAILVSGLLAMAQVLTYSVMASKTYGRDAAKATAAAQDKIEELTGLDYGDTTTNLTVNAPYTADGAGLAEGGSIAPAAAEDGYADYLDAAGTRTAAGDAVFTRQWQIIDDATGTEVKRILVSVTSDRSFQVGEAPNTVLVTEKTP